MGREILKKTGKNSQTNLRKVQGCPREENAGGLATQDFYREFIEKIQELLY
jgi:hypothetical protein